MKYLTLNNNGSFCASNYNSSLVNNANNDNNPYSLPFPN